MSRSSRLFSAADPDDVGPHPAVPSARASRIWPVTLASGRVVLRPLRYGDLGAWREVRIRNRDWLKHWEPTADVGWAARHTRWRFLRFRSNLARAAREDRMLAFVICIDGRLAGQVHLGPLLRGSLRSADVGYWIDRRYAGQGCTPVAVALVVQHAFATCGLHRVHAAIQPDNAASLRVVEKLGFRREGYYERYLDIDGSWRDHIGFALTADEDLSALREVLRAGA